MLENTNTGDILVYFTRSNVYITQVIRLTKKYVVCELFGREIYFVKKNGKEKGTSGTWDVRYAEPESEEAIALYRESKRKRDLARTKIEVCDFVNDTDNLEILNRFLELVNGQ